MKLTALAVLFATTILMTGAISASVSVQYADAMKGQGVTSSSYGLKTKGMICGDRLCSEIPGGRAAWESEQGITQPVIPDYGLENKNLETKDPTKFQYQKSDSTGTCQCGPDGCNCPGCNCSEDGMCNCHGEPYKCSCGGHGSDGTCTNCDMLGYGSMKDHVMPIMKSVTGVVKSETDPGLGHEQHQLAVLLPPSDKMYKGMLTYSASENVQLVALHGPLTDDEVMGQTIWTPDGKTKFALTLVDQQNKMGSWMFTGNALAVHSFSTEPFSLSYSLHYAKVSDGHAMYGSCNCAADCNCSEDGTCTCSGEEGPCMCGPNCTCGSDGTCNCAEGCSCDQGGACICSGEAGPCMCGPNCDCGYSMKYESHGTGCNCSEDGMCNCHGEPYKCSCGGHGSDGTCTNCGMSGYGHHMYGYGYHGMGGHMMTAHSETIQSETDPGLGHEQHQLAVLLPPSSNVYAGMLTYSASENVQLVALHGPLTDDEVMGQTIWTPDGKTKFALTLVDQQNKMGSWMFTGNALAVHSFSTEPFAVTYSIVTMGSSDMSVHEMRSHGATCNCAADCNCSEDGTCTCSGEEGPCMCGPNCTCGSDGTCNCAEGCSCDQGGACICSGEAGPCMCGPNCDCGQ